MFRTFCKSTGILLLGLLLLGELSACKHYAAFVYSAVDPAYSPVKTDPVWVTLSARPTIRERQLIVVLKSELAKNGFTVVESEGQSRWVLGLSAERRTYDFGTINTTTAFAVTPNMAIATTRSSPNIVEKSTIYLYLFDTEDFRAGKVLSLWEGSATATENVYRVYMTAMIKNLLDVFGKNYERNTRLSKDYVNEGHPDFSERTQSKERPRHQNFP